MADETRETPESISSVVLSRNAKGGTQITVKIYNENPDKAVEKCKDLYNSLCEKYNA